jgi:transcriptional regulator with XRE-family HTH domain
MPKRSVTKRSSARDICLRLGQRIQRLRAARGWAQSDLAAHSGIGRQFISDLENGKQEPRLRTLEDLANSFDMTVSQLMRGL